ncbi:non-functional pseudokinase ZED1-like [Pistacia vera]|uniref:non-functional pseudokinase ZED1-like n=1 Tax=Pistacia vera TaxID=55513 RepID=UPI001262F02E|nr:non-functional pseudokinase ZED1-like [Pistacia vera]
MALHYSGNFHDLHSGANRPVECGSFPRDDQDRPGGNENCPAQHFCGIFHATWRGMARAAPFHRVSTPQVQIGEPFAVVGPTDDGEDFQEATLLSIFILLHILHPSANCSRDLSQNQAHISFILTPEFAKPQIKENQEKADRKQREAFMVENGKFVLEKLIASCNGKCNPIRSFSIKELKQAINDYDRQKMITKGGGYELYRGDFHYQDRLISVLKFNDYWMNHKNILKLIGSCLETHLPILVFEYVKHGTFRDQSDSSFQLPPIEPLQLTHRLNIAMEIANAVAYLHLGFSRPILFKDINSSHILFDENYVPKLFNFSVSEFIPEGETHITNGVRGTSGHVAPESLHTG